MLTTQSVELPTSVHYCIQYNVRVYVYRYMDVYMQCIMHHVYEKVFCAANITRIFYLLMLILPLIHFMYKNVLRFYSYNVQYIQRDIFFVFISFWFNAANSLKIYIFYVLLLFDSSSCLGLQLVEITAATIYTYQYYFSFFFVII